MNLAKRLASRSVDLTVRDLPIQGRVVATVGLSLRAEGCRLPVGARCLIGEGAAGDSAAGHEAEVIGFDRDDTWLMPISRAGRIEPGASVRPIAGAATVPVGERLLGRVIDAAGRPLDDLGPLRVSRHVTLDRAPISPLERAPIQDAFAVGVRAIDALLTLGRGQRVGLMAGSGVGKSALLGMITRHSSADVTVVALVGERGREVRDFVEDSLGAEGLSRAVVVAEPADSPPLARLRAALSATAIAEGFRDEGKEVLLLVDSLSRFAQAQREVGLAAGEMPVSKGYPLSVFSALPGLLERAGALASGGSITGIYTVLAEGDDQLDPIVDTCRAILDGHIVLSRKLADAAHYPAVDIGQSVSRTRSRVNDAQHESRARRALSLAAAWRVNEDMVRAGLYQHGSDPLIDAAILFEPRMNRFLQQGTEHGISMEASRAALEALVTAMDSRPGAATEQGAS